MKNKSPERIIRSPDRIGMAGRLPRLRFIYARALDSVISRWLQVERFNMLLLFLDGFDGRLFALSRTRGRTSRRISQCFMER